MTAVRACFAIACLLPPVCARAQQTNVNLDYNPQKNTENLIPFSATLNSPDVRDDRTVTFRLKAPAAKEVLLSGVAILTALGKSGRSVPVTKGDDGVWTLTVGPLSPDMYIADPNNAVAGFTAMPLYSQLVVHGSGPAYYDARNVPHGTVTRHVYHSGVTNGERELYVYTPPGYSRGKRYPVLYLVLAREETDRLAEVGGQSFPGADRLQQARRERIGGSGEEGSGRCPATTESACSC